MNEESLSLFLLPFLSLTWNTKILFVHLKTSQSKNKHGKPRNMVLLYAKSKPLRTFPLNWHENKWWKAKWEKKQNRKKTQMYFQKIWVVFIPFLNSVARTLYFASVSLSFLVYNVEPTCPAPHTTDLLVWVSRERKRLKVCYKIQCAPQECVAVHSPNTVLAGTDSLLSQNDTWERMTVMMQGRYVWITKYPIFLFKWKWAVITVYSPRRKI